ncbi:MAG: hypothetical protein ABJA90_01990 [Ginsengibacter sp.]
MKLATEHKIYFTLRIASAMCFIGHGAFGIITKPIWANYFGVFGIGHDLSFRLMPLIGIIDILLGLAILLYPIRAVFVWLIAWGAITALLRPLSGEPFAEFIERAGNFGAPLALLIFTGGSDLTLKKLFTPMPKSIKPGVKSLERLVSCLQIVIFLLFAGHGWLNIIEKKSLLDQYRLLGFINPATTAQAIGIFEVIVAISILIRPIRTVVLILFFWKIGSELFYPHYEFFEWIERGGSYGAILALWFALDMIPSLKGKNHYAIPGIFLLNRNRINIKKSLPHYNIEFDK